MNFTTKDSGKRVEFPSGFNRDVQENKPRYDLIPTSMLKRLAELYARGADKYGDDNYQKANTPEEYQRFKASGFRHFEDWRAGKIDEDHAMGAIWNIISYEWHMEKEEPTPPEHIDKDFVLCGDGVWRHVVFVNNVLFVNGVEQSPTLLEQSDYDEGLPTFEEQTEINRKTMAQKAQLDEGIIHNGIIDGVPIAEILAEDSSS